MSYEKLKLPLAKMRAMRMPLKIMNDSALYGGLSGFDTAPSEAASPSKQRKVTMPSL